MRIRHLIAAADVHDRRIIVPERVRHGIVVGGRIASLASFIDPLTHLNLDFTDHRLDMCLVAMSLDVGAPIMIDNDGWQLAYVLPSAFAHLGRVDVGARRVAWQDARQGDRETRR